MRIRNRKVPLPLSSLSPIPLSDPQFSQSPVVQLQLHSIPHQNLLQEPQKDEYFDPQLPSDQLNQPIGGGSEGHDDCFCVAGPQEENKVLLQDEIKGGGGGETSNDARKGSFLSEGVHVTVLQQSSSSHRGAGRWGEGDRAFPLKKRRGSFERRSDEETIMDRNKKTKTKMNTTMNKKCETKEDAISKVKTKAKGGALLEGSRCSRVNGRGWRCFQQTLVGYSLCEHHLGKGRLRSMSSVRRRSIATTVPEKDEHGAYRALHYEKVRGAANNEDDRDDKEKPLMISRRKLKLGMVKARSISSLLGQANYAIGVAENNE
ncbi:WRC domain-containing protein [Salix suchowensis]|nr:WRC domain-containing protein [Salix suchowensis]